MPWGAIASAGIGLLGGALNSRKRTNTSTSTYERELTPDQITARDNYLGGALDMVNNPGAGLTPIKNGLLQDVSRQYAGAPQRLQRSASLRGFGDSGKLFEGLMSFDTARSGAMAGVGNKMAELEIDQKNRGFQMLMNLLSQNNKSKQTGNQSYGGINPITGALNGALYSGSLGKLFEGFSGGGMLGNVQNNGDFGGET